MTTKPENSWEYSNACVFFYDQLLSFIKYGSQIWHILAGTWLPTL